MGLFDKLKNTAASAVGGAVNNAAMSIGNKSETFTFTALPESLAQMQALPEASLDSPFKTAALTVCALCAYAADKNIGTEMLNWLRGPVRSTVRKYRSLTTVSVTERPIFRSRILREQHRIMITRLQSRSE